MNKKNAGEEKLKNFLNNECNDFDLEYEIEWVEDYDNFEAVVSREDKKVSVFFKYNENTKNLSIELSEDSYYVTEHFDWTVKYFWMLIAPALFPNQ